jgi:hypothetical protein
MAILNNSNAISTTGDYAINNSLRFRRSATAYLSRTPASVGTQTTWTWSGWVKRSIFGSQQKILTAGSTGSLFASFEFIAGDNFQFYAYNGATNAYLVTTQVFRDPSAWYHIVFAVDTTQATASNRIKIYVNGTQVTAFSTSTYPSQNFTFPINNNVIHNIGRDNVNAGDYFDGYLADVNFIDGSQKAASDFGETDTTTGSWKPKAYTGTYGTNGFYLKFSDIATTSGSNAGLGKDFSGNANYWNTNNISVTAGVTYDAMSDVPTLTSATVANYAVMNPLTGASTMTLLDGNLNTSSTAYGVHRYGTIGVSSGKWYWEASPTAMSGASNGMLVGISNDISETGATLVGIRGYLSGNGNKYTGSSGSAYGATWTTNDIIGMALDLDAGTLTFYKNNVSQGTAFTGLTGQWFPLIRTDATVTSFINFGQRPFSYTPPTGFVRLNTFNLPDSTIKKGNTVMDAITYTGNGSTQTVTGLDFTPGMLWIKDRSAITNHQVNDQVRGVGRELQPDETSAETNNNIVTAFNSNGFSISSNGNVNANGNSYVAWSWKANGAGSSNTSGTITSSVSVNATAGFSVVTWTGNGTIGATVGHGLGVAPSMIIVKQRSGTEGWPTYHISLGATKYLNLNQTIAAATSITRWNNTTPSSTVITLYNDAATNGSSSTYVAYCFAEIAGFSKFGSYTGNSNADGPFVYLGFRPEFIIVKRSDSGNYWVMQDSSRSTFNVVNKYLAADDPLAEATSSQVNIDFLSNGFKVRSSFDIINAGTYIYMAFAENPFKNANAR